MPPPVQLFLTTIASAPVLRQKQEYLLRTLQVLGIPFVSYDLASDPNAKRLWRRKAPKDKQELPGILIGNVWPGTFEQFESAVENGTIEVFLRQKEEYDADVDGKVLEAQPVGIPGAVMPEQMTGHKPSFAPNGPTPMRKSGPAGSGEEIVDAGDVLPGYGFQGLKVTINELADLAKELGLEDKPFKGKGKGKGEEKGEKKWEEKGEEENSKGKGQSSKTENVEHKTEKPITSSNEAPAPEEPKDTTKEHTETAEAVKEASGESSEPPKSD
ncbi:hypothetical protein FS842_001569 [Serendipita sp. 407]|nr:hypothetical protein FS842_001569 [Serendipita sp. 407]